jgi:hypothetical protein
MNKIIFLDLETENHPYFGAVASPRHPENYVVANGWAVDDPSTGQGAVQHLYFHSKEEATDWLHIPEDCWLLVCHNAAFELDWMLFQQREKIMAFLKRGGRVWCTAYSHYLLSNQQDTYPALDVIAPMYGGTHKVDGIKILWEQGYRTSQIEKDHLLKYLCDPVEGDVANTRTVFYQQYSNMSERGMLDMFWLRMDGLVYNTLAMDAGLFVNREIAFAQLEAQTTRLEELRANFALFRTQIPEYIGFKDSSPYHMSAWLFGGPIKYKVKDTWFEEDGTTPKWEKVECYTFENGMVLPVATADTLTEAQASQMVAQYGPLKKYSAGKNKGQRRIDKVDSEVPKQKYYERIFNCQPLVDLTFLPKELHRSFKEEFAGKRTLSDGSFVWSTGKDSIEMLSKRPEYDDGVRGVLTLLLEFFKLDKDLGTYYLREVLDEEGNVTKQSGMLQYLTPQGIVYHGLNTTSTVTTRLSGTRPNMQNIPRGDTSDVKKVFTSRYDNKLWLVFAFQSGIIDKVLLDRCLTNIEAGVPNGRIIEADYSAVEVVTLAAFSKDKNLVAALLEGIDMHCLRLSKKLGEPYEDVLLKCKDEQHPEHTAYKTMRTDIKPPSFAYQYGATAAGIAFATGCTIEYAEEFIATEKALFPDVEAFYNDVITPLVEKNAVVRREQVDGDVWRVYKSGYWESPGKTRYEFRQFNKTRWVNGQKVELMEFKPTQIRNYPIQGESGFFLQGMAGQVARWFVSRDMFNGKACIINQVHDALYFDVHNDVLDEVCRTVKSIMESLPTFFGKYGYDLGVPFPAEVEHGLNMHKKEKFVEPVQSFEGAPQ